jgi:hypothetical protein
MNRAFLVVLALAVASCKTVGISMTPSGYAEVSPQIANEMIDARRAGGSWF